MSHDDPGAVDRFDAEAAEAVRDDPFADDALDALGLGEGDDAVSVPAGALDEVDEVDGHPDHNESLGQPAEGQ